MPNVLTDNDYLIQLLSKYTKYVYLVKIFCAVNAQIAALSKLGPKV